MVALLVLLAGIIFQTVFAADQLAFPGAEGFGRFATGGRSGSSYVVRSLEDSGPGTLRDALSQPGRVITFNISGVIRIKKRLVIPKATTILGQTAPGQGITTYGNGWSGSGADGSIIRYLRIRMGKFGDSKKDSLTVANGYNIIFDHVSVSWGRNKVFNIDAMDKAGNITISDCIIAQGLQPHSAGSLMESNTGISIFRTLYIDHKTRNPKVKGRNDYINCVIYNWGAGGGYVAGGSESPSWANIVNNYFISGPNTGHTKAFVRGNGKFAASVRGNYWDSNRDGILNGKEIPVDQSSYGGMNLTSRSFGYPGPGRVMSAPDALDYVLRNAGTSKVRDAVDNQLINEVKSYGKSGKIISDENETVWGSAGKETLKRDMAMQDFDGDGIPDWYEQYRGWDVYQHDSMVIETSGYTRLEEYANSLISHI